jgi:hypothetical protein
MRKFRQVAGVVALGLAAFWSGIALAADREAYRHFLEVTGFDVAITSMQQDAMAGPGLAGGAPDAFGAQWVALARKVFDPEDMLGRTIDMMQSIMPDDLLTFGEDFYASELGQRLVTAENEAAQISDDERHSAGEQIMADLLANNPGRLDDYQAMMDAIGGVDASVRAVSEIQVRYLLAADAAGAIDLGLSEQDLRDAVKAQAPQMREAMAQFSILGAAYTYRDMSDEDIKAYRAILEDDRMQQVYQILNGIQYEVMADRYEVLAAGLKGLTPQQTL